MAQRLLQNMLYGPNAYYINSLRPYQSNRIDFEEIKRSSMSSEAQRRKLREAAINHTSSPPLVLLS